MHMGLVKNGVIIFLVIFFIVCGPFLILKLHADDKPQRLSPATRKVLLKSQEAIKQKQYQKARNVLQIYLKDHFQESTVDVYLLLGNAFFMEDLMTSACNTYYKGMKRFPNNFFLIQNYAIASYYNKNFQDAGDYFLKAYENNPEKSNVNLLYKAASAYYNAKNFQSARQTLEKLMITAEDIKSEWQKILVYTYISLEEWHLAENTLYLLLAEDKKNAGLWKLLAKLYLNQHNYKNTASALQISYEINQPKPSEWENLSDIYLYLNAPLKANACIIRAYEKNLKVEHYKKLSHSYARALRYNKAIRYINLAIKNEPTAENYRIRAKFYYKNQQFKEALNSFKIAVDKNPKDSWSWLMIGFCAMEIDQWKLAHKAFSIASKSKKYDSWAQPALSLVNDIINVRKKFKETSLKSK